MNTECSLSARAARLLTPVLLICMLSQSASRCHADPANQRVLLQGFWWDYWNNHHPANWSTYLADLAPRLRAMGIDAIWIPPTSKNKNATGSVGYAPFDHYDLGDKRQGGGTATRFGTKDELLRSVAILHANGIEVVQDIVWNHMNGAGATDGSGGEDPAARSNRFKNFRNVCFATPATSESAAHYLARRGRFPKNWQNFHPNPDHDTEQDDITAGWFGPDLCYHRNATGRSSNASFNPSQASDYVRNQMRSWSVWLKKQTGVDGFRVDAVKHFEPWVTKDFLWNMAYNSGFATQGRDMFAVGEYVGDRSQLDAWVDAVNNSDGFTDVTGAFDFSLRSAIKSMVSGGGFHDLGSIPASQQERRSRAVSFVNSHDTFRPRLDSNGRYIGWDTANELGEHIDPNDRGIQAAYAVIFAVDGSPCVFFEDLFDLHSTGKRWSHRPGDPVELPVRDYLANLIWCHEALRFKEGAYRVRWQAQDLLIVERQGRAIIGVSDHGNTWQQATVQTGFPAGTTLHDYSGSNEGDVVVGSDGRVTLHVPPTDGGARRRGYAVWGPAGVANLPGTKPIPTVQEWELSDDLGDSHPDSLQQGGALPGQSLEPRIAGRVYPAKGSLLRADVYATRPGQPVVLEVLEGERAIQQITGTNHVSLLALAQVSGYHTIRVRNASSQSPGQTAFVKASYTAPRDRLAQAPTITTQPTDIGLVAGQPARFTVAATGGPPLVFEWKRPETQAAHGTGQILEFTGASPSDAGGYEVTVSNEGGQETSRTAMLWVHANDSPEGVRTALDSGGRFTLEVEGKRGIRYRVESSDDLVGWQDLETKTAPFQIEQPIIASGHRYFRVVPLRDP